MPIKSKQPPATIVDKPFHEIVLSRVYEKAASEPHSQALIDAFDVEKFYTFAEVYLFSHAFGTALRDLSINPRDVVLAAVPQSIQAPIVLFGTWLRGAALSAVNPVYNPEELRRQMVDCRAKIAVCVEENLGNVLKAIELLKGQIKNVIVIGLTQEATSGNVRILKYEELIKTKPDAKATQVHIDTRNDVCLLPYSSGTTGPPKGVMLTHYNLSSMLAINDAHTQRNIWPAFDPPMGQRPDETSLNFLPFFHIFGMQLCVLMMYNGFQQLVMARFDPLVFLQTLQDRRIRSLYCVPPIAVMLAKHPIVDNFDLSAMEALFCGAAPLTAETEEQLRKRFPTLRHVSQGYGMTELSLAVTLANLVDKPRPGTGGQLAPNIELMIVDTQSGKELGVRQHGEICVRGPNVMKGYFNRADATAATIDKNGWLHTGDIGYYDEDQYVYIVDRLKELIKVKGFQVPPAELEGLLLTHEGIADAAVIGIADEMSGELPRAYVVRKETHASLTEADVQKFIADRVSTYKQLKGGVVFLDAIPKSPSGKILRRELRAQAQRAKM